MKQIPTSDSSGSMRQDELQREAVDLASDGNGWLAEILRRQAQLDEPADEGFAAAVMQILPERSTGSVVTTRKSISGDSSTSVLPGWLATLLPLLGVYGLVVTAATMQWLALTLAVIPGVGAPPLLGPGVLEAWESLANSLVIGLAHWLAPAMILGWLAWWLHQQEWLLE
ncbi:hypothetical protein BCF11_1265 [Collimonas sp. PA-H2]|uniref:hypothetical protein n=1 Tax=Collimonas sp. PA-H2 TaxID=1881062 RepID=UPI000BFA7FA6|nr:hypothetical protein [Collimonas sp. PA-H2]PFH08890.1 hypothetical protein BCF11_1265 [Collimonas sp. PA-H2]